MEDQNSVCANKANANESCTCPKVECPRHGNCCECIATHKNKDTDSILVKFPYCLRDLVKEAADKA